MRMDFLRMKDLARCFTSSALWMEDRKKVKSQMEFSFSETEIKPSLLELWKEIAELMIVGKHRIFDLPILFLSGCLSILGDDIC